jgi:hypothetical protein
MPQQVTIYKKIIFGTTDRKVLSSAPDTKFMELRVQSSATSGDNRAIYNRLYLSGIGGGGESLRSYTDVVGVAVGTVHGAHISLGFGESTTKGNATGLGVAVRATLGIPNAAMAADGTYAALMAEIYSFGSSSAVSAVTELSFIKCVAGGNGTGAGRVDDKAYLLVIDGVAEGSGNMIVASASEANYASAARCLINGVEKWLMFASASG